MPARLADDWEQLTQESLADLLAAQDDLRVGYMIWLKLTHSKAEIKEAREALKRRHLHRLRTGLSWCEWVSGDEVRNQILENLKGFSDDGFAMLLCLSFTPPTISMATEESERYKTNVPPKNPLDYAAFVKEVILALREHDIRFVGLELWNEWNLDTDWNAEVYDPRYEHFVAMIAAAAKVAHELGAEVTLGGMSKANETSLALVREFAARGLFSDIDYIGFHNLRGTWSDSAPQPTLMEQALLVKEAAGIATTPVLSEYGFPVRVTKLTHDRTITLEELERIQVALFAYMVYSSLKGYIECGYWYTLRDEEHVSLRAATTGWEDVLQWYFGDTDEAGNVRLLGRLLIEGGPAHVLRYAVAHGLMPLVKKASLGRVLES